MQQQPGLGWAGPAHLQGAGLTEGWRSGQEPQRARCQQEGWQIWGFPIAEALTFVYALSQR